MIFTPILLTLKPIIMLTLELILMLLLTFINLPRLKLRLINC